MRKLIFFLFVTVLILPSCRLLRPDIMLKTPRDYKYATIKDTTAFKEYRIRPNDMIEFRLFSNDGFKLIDLTTLNSNAILAQSTILSYLVENDSTIKLPVLDRIKLAGLTIRQAETLLETKYAQYYVKPFVLIRVTNKRVIIFPGSGGLAKVLPITNNNTSLIEVLALAGGLPEYAKSYKIKVIRGNPQKPDVYRIDLEKIDGVPMANMIVQNNDIIYVEPRIRFTSEVVKEITPALTILTSAFLVYSIYLQAKH